MTRRALRHGAIVALVLCAGFGAVVGLEALAHHQRLADPGAVAAPTLACADPGAPGGDACAATLGDARYATLLGAPVAAWALAGHLVVWLLAWCLAGALASRGRAALGPALVALGVMAGALALGSVGYLVLGLAVLGVSCPLCMMLHGAAAGVTLVVAGALLGWRREVGASLREARGWAAAAAALALWAALAYGGAAVTGAGAAHAAPGPLTAAAGVEAYAEELAQVCAPEGCPAALVMPTRELPTANESLVLVDPPGGPVLVEMLDLGCEACRRQHGAVAPLYRELVRTGRAGLRLVIWPRDPACNPLLSGRSGGGGGCEANAALICALRHGGAEAALDYLDWELGAAAGYHTDADRGRWLAGEVDRLAARCFEAERAMAGRGTLGLHADYVSRLRAVARRRPECAAAAPGAGGPWWCFSATPSFAVFRDDLPARVEGSAVAASAGPALRRVMLERCLERER